MVKGTLTKRENEIAKEFSIVVNEVKRINESSKKELSKRKYYKEESKRRLKHG